MARVFGQRWRGAVLSLPVRTTRQVALLSIGICASILVPALLIVRWFAPLPIDNTTSAILVIAVGLAISTIVGGLVTLLFAGILRQMIANLRTLAPLESRTSSPLHSPGTALSDLNHHWAKIAADQQSLRRRNSELQVLATVSRALNRASSLEEMLDIVLEYGTELCAYDKGFIALADEDSHAFQVLASRGYQPHELDDLVVEVENGATDSWCVNLPLRALDQTTGLLHLEGVSLELQSHHSLGLLVDILATAIEKHRLLEATQREVRAQRLLNEAGRVLTSTLDKQEVLTRVLRQVLQVLNAAAGSVVLVDEERGDMFFVAAISPEESQHLVGTRMPLGRGIVGWAIQHRKSVLIGDAHADTRFYSEIDQQTGFHTESVACVPLSAKDQVIGAIEVMNSRSGEFTVYDLQLLESLAPQAAIAIENAVLFDSVKAQMAELERTQSQLLQAEKLSAIGRLVAGVAHELNNPLTAIVGYAQLLRETCDDPQICEDLERIHSEAQRSARIVQNLLAFARQQEMEKHPIELGSILNRTIDLIAYQLEVDNINVVRQIDPQPMIVYGDTYQLQQVFLNLITNAHQAMRKAHGGGTLTICAAVKGQETVQVRFVDDGPGIPKEIMGRIFDPFFTTKDVGEGTGLGLSICLGIVQEHEGQIEAESQDRQGTVFTVELPLHRDTLDTGLFWETSDKVTSAHHLSVLVVDDEESIAHLLKRILETEGHRVTTVGTASQAERLLDGQTFDLIICDLKMPGMSGRDLYAHLLRDHPKQAERVIFSTGDVGSQESWAFLQEVGNRYISKPFNPEQILAEIREAITG